MRHKRNEIAVIPARKFLNTVLLTHSFMPDKVYLDEGILVSAVFDAVFNDHVMTADELFKHCCNVTSYAGLEEIADVKRIIADNMPYYAELLSEARDNIKQSIPFYNYADLYRISWETRSIYLKAL